MDATTRPATAGEQDGAYSLHRGAFDSTTGPPTFHRGGAKTAKNAEMEQAFLSSVSSVSSALSAASR